MASPVRGEVWIADLDPIRGHEQAGTRPVLIVSDDAFNHGPAGLVVACPITSRDRGTRFYVRLSPSEGGLDRDSFVMCDQPRTISKERLKKKLGEIGQSAMEATEVRLVMLLGLQG